MMYYVRKVLVENYANFNGRASRSEYWYYFLFNLLLNIPLTILSYVAQFNDIQSLYWIVTIISLIYSLGVLIPSIAVGVRRFHDTGRSGWWMLLNLLFCCGIGPLICLIMLAMGGDADENEYGPVPED